MKIRIFLFTFILFLSPMLTFAHGEQESIEKLNSEAVLLMDANSGQVLFSVNGKKILYPASITKIITAIVAIEEGNLTDSVTVSEKARNTEGTRVYLLEGERVTLEKLIQGLLINSGNDAGVAIAEHIDGSTEDFALRMNRFVKEKAGVKNTNFTNPHGLHDANHYTTPYEMALITRYAIQNEVFLEIFGTKELEWDGEGWDTTLYNHNQLLWRYDGATGGKNGFVNAAGHTLVTTASRNGTNLIAVTMKAPSKELAYSDTIKLFDYGFADFKTKKITEGRTFVTNTGSWYKLNDTVLYTENLHIPTKIDIWNDTLVITEGENVLVEEFLEKVKPIPKTTKETIESLVQDKDKEIKQDVKSKEGKQSSSFLSWSLLISFMLLFCITFIGRKIILNKNKFIP